MSHGEVVGESNAPADNLIINKIATVTPPESDRNRFKVNIKVNLTISQIISLIQRVVLFFRLTSAANNDIETFRVTVVKF